MTGIYFSGTGSTALCLSEFLKHCGGGETVSVEEPAAVEAIARERELVFAYPIYYSSLPKIVRDFIEEHSALWNGKRIYIIVTMGLFSGDGAGVSARLFRRYGAEVIGGLHLKMPDCIGDVKALKRSFEENRKIVEASLQKIETAARRLSDGDPIREGLSFFSHMVGLFGQRLYFGRKTRDYRKAAKIDEEKCVGCGTCVKLCPMKNIRIEDGMAFAGEQCTLCYRCFCACSHGAVTILGNRVYEQNRPNRYFPRSDFSDKLSKEQERTEQQNGGNQ